MAQTVAEILIDQMVEAGIRKVYGIVGDSANPIVDALRRHAQRRPHGDMSVQEDFRLSIRVA